MTRSTADAIDSLTDHLANALTDYTNRALDFNEGEPVSIPLAVLLAGREIRAGLERLAEAIEKRGGKLA
jgi:hypothetical protein